jgi:hypothetical protein
VSEGGTEAGRGLMRETKIALIGVLTAVAKYIYIYIYLREGVADFAPERRGGVMDSCCCTICVCVLLNMFIFNVICTIK